MSYRAKVDLIQANQERANLRNALEKAYIANADLQNINAELVAALRQIYGYLSQKDATVTAIDRCYFSRDTARAAIAKAEQVR